MIKLIKEILSQNAESKVPHFSNEDIDLISYVIEFFSNFIYNNKKNREYFILKGGLSLTSKFLDRNY